MKVQSQGPIDTVNQNSLMNENEIDVESQSKCSKKTMCTPWVIGIITLLGIGLCIGLGFLIAHLVKEDYTRAESIDKAKAFFASGIDVFGEEMMWKNLDKARGLMTDTQKEKFDEVSNWFVDNYEPKLGELATHFFGPKRADEDKEKPVDFKKRSDEVFNDGSVPVADIIAEGIKLHAWFKEHLKDKKNVTALVEFSVNLHRAFKNTIAEGFVNEIIDKLFIDTLEDQEPKRLDVADLIKKAIAKEGSPGVGFCPGAGHQKSKHTPDYEPCNYAQPAQEVYGREEY